MPNENRQAGVNETEVTQEMLEAGEEESTSYDSRVDNRKDVVREIFLVMYAILKQSKAGKVLRCE